MRCVVLGGGGFVGSHLSEALLASGYDVTVFDRSEARYLEYAHQKGTNLFIGDFLNPGDLSRGLSNCDVVFHLACTTVPQTSNDNPSYDAETNILGTLRLLDAARKAQVKKIIFASSGGTVYGIPQEIPIKEGHPTEPTSSYGITKLTIEKYLHLYWSMYELDYCILRIANAYGERQPITTTQGVIAAFLDTALRQNAITVWGDGTIRRDYIYAGDIASAFVKASTHAGELRIFNIGAGQGHSLKDIISMIENITQRPLQVRYTPGRSFDVPVNVLDVSRAIIHLNWQLAVGIL